MSVKFEPIGRAHTFLLPDIEFDAPLEHGDPVVVTRADAHAYGTVTRSIPSVTARKVPHGDKDQRVLRKATKQDITTRLKHQHREREAQQIGGMLIRERGLPMKLVRVEQLFEASRLIFYFTADSRVDFRDLVRDLASQFRCRIEMRQIGARDEAKLLGGYGTCGRPLCCTTWLQGFAPISIKMAKRQNLSLNPSRLSGLCGRLKCCLRYELPNAAGKQFAGCANESTCGGGGGCGEGGGCGGGCGGDCGTGGCSGCT